MNVRHQTDNGRFNSGGYTLGDKKISWYNGMGDIFQFNQSRQIYKRSLSEMCSLKPLPTTYTYNNETSHLIVKGENVTVSDMVKYENWSKARLVYIFALNEILIDTNINKTGEEAGIMIYAPNWKVSRTTQFILNGQDASAYSSAANKGIGREEAGDDGEGGKPGGPAGHFYSIGITSKASDLLSIYAIGGQGGTGQTGGDGNISNFKYKNITIRIK